ncbi:MAG: DUF5711 family protein [Bacillota bacterium]|nr:DUF5711 family protein [Bacillota bacterium]
MADDINNINDGEEKSHKNERHLYNKNAEGNEGLGDANEMDDETEFEKPVRKTKSRKKKGILKYIIAAIVLLAVIRAGIDFFGGNKNGPEKEETVINDQIDLDTSSKYDFNIFENYLIVCNKYGVYAYNASGSVKWKYETNITDPISSTCGDYLLVTDTTQNNSIMFNNHGELKNKVSYETDCITAEPNNNGWITAIVRQKGYKAQINVYNSEGKLKYSWSSANNNVLAASLADDNKTLAVAQLDSSSSDEANGVVSLFDITTAGKPYFGKNTGSNIITYIRWNGEKLTCVGGSKTFRINKNGSDLWKYSYPSGDMVLYNAKSNGVYAYAINSNSTSASKITTIYTISDDGKQLGSTKIEGDVHSIETRGNKIAVITSNSIITLRRNATVKKINNLSKDISKGLVFDSNAFVVSGTSAEIIPIN